MKIIRTISKQERVELIQEMAEYYIENSGMTMLELADTYGRPYSTVYNWMTYQLPKLDMKLFNQFRNSMKHEKECHYSIGRVKINRQYSCLPAILRGIEFDARVYVLFQVICSNREVIPDWDEVTNLLFYDKDTHGFNLITSVESYEDLSRLYKIVKTAIKDPHKGQWHKRICKTCGKEFVLSLGNYQFFHKDFMYLPNNCKSCRHKRRMRNHE